MFNNETAPMFFSVAAIFVLAEILWRRRIKREYDFAAFGSTLVIMLGQFLTKMLSAWLIVTALFFAYKLSPIKLAETDWRAWLLGFFLVELAYYWQHRLSHTVRWMWASHSVHHSATDLVLLSAFRLSWTNWLSAAWLVFLPVALLGIHPLVIGTLLAINLRYQFFLHTDHVRRLGWLEWLFNTPSNHRVHHSSLPQHLDKNFGGILMLFDHIFGSYTAESNASELRYGLTKPIKSYNPLIIVFHEWGRMLADIKRATSWRALLIVTFGRPGQSSDTSDSVQRKKINS